MARERRPNKVYLAEPAEDLSAAVHSSLLYVGLLQTIDSGTRVALKPNLTYPFYKRGVTTSPAVVRATVEVLKEKTDHIAIVESDGGYGAWKAEEAFSGHGLYELADELGIEIVNLSQGERREIEIRDGFRRGRVSLPARLLEETDVFISMPVPKIHCMTGVSLAFKNQWGCIPDMMRLRRHYLFSDAIVEINRLLRPWVLADGSYFLDKNGPMDGEAVRMDLIIAASDPGSFDRYVTELMGVPWGRVDHLRNAARRGLLPRELGEIDHNVPPARAKRRDFTLHRTPRNWISLAGFKSRTMTWLGYESWFGREVLHRLLYLVAGRAVRPTPED